MFHVAPLMNSEQRRRLIGNDVLILFFHDDEQSFDMNQTHKDMGSFSQVFAVVQPHPEMEGKFRFLQDL